MPCGKFMLLLLRVISVVPQHNGIIPKNYSTVFRHCPRIRLLGLSFNQCRLYPHIYHFNLPFGRSLTVGWLMALPTCYVPLWGFPLRLAVVNGHFKHLPSRLPKRHSSNSLYGRTKYSSNRTSSVLIAYWEQWAIIRLSDNGVGMSDADKENLFKLFYRGENKNIASGNGIGMVLTQKIIHLHKGELTVSSHKDEGTTFVVKLPHI